MPERKIDRTGERNKAAETSFWFVSMSERAGNSRKTAEKASAFYSMRCQLMASHWLHPIQQRVRFGPRRDRSGHNARHFVATFLLPRPLDGNGIGPGVD